MRQSADDLANCSPKKYKHISDHHICDRQSLNEFRNVTIYENGQEHLPYNSNAECVCVCLCNILHCIYIQAREKVEIDKEIKNIVWNEITESGLTNVQSMYNATKHTHKQTYSAYAIHIIYQSYVMNRSK